MTYRISRVSTLRAVVLAGTGAFAAATAFAQNNAPAPNAPNTPAAAPSANPQAPNTTATPAMTPHNQSVIGLPVISADGQTVGQVLSVGPGENQKMLAFIVKPTAVLGAKGGEIFIPTDKAELNGRSIQLMVTLADVKKFYVR